MPKKTHAETIAGLLETAQHHVAEAEARIDDQIRRIEKFRAKGWDLADAERILAEMHWLLEISIRHRDELAWMIERGRISK